MNDCRRENFAFVTLAQVLGCLLVIFGHSYPFVTDVPKWIIDVRTFIYCFHMPLFVWCSGYLLVKTESSLRYSFSQYAVRRAKKLIVPYIALSLIGLVPKVLFSGLLNDTLRFDDEMLIRAFLVPRENIWGHFWFLPMIFLMGLAGFVADKICHSQKMRSCFFGAFTIIFVCGSFISFKGDAWLGIRDFLDYFWMYCFGAFCATFTAKSDYRAGGILSAILSVAGVVMFLFMKDAQGISRKLLGMFIAALMTMAVVFLCRHLEKSIKIPSGSVLTQTFTVFILSWPCQLLAEVVTERLLGLPTILVMLSMFIAGIAGSVIIIKLIDFLESKTHTKTLSFLLGR